VHKGAAADGQFREALRVVVDLGSLLAIVPTDVKRNSESLS
jgi:hypothetical protein